MIGVMMAFRRMVWCFPSRTPRRETRSAATRCAPHRLNMAALHCAGRKQCESAGKVKRRMRVHSCRG